MFIYEAELTVNCFCVFLQVDSGNDTEKKIHSSAFLSNMQVSCPLCDQGFSPAKIELHAMYCNGLVEQEKGKDSASGTQSGMKCIH